jgi:tetratricopeptide (TPR) repeat protein
MEERHASGPTRAERVHALLALPAVHGPEELPAVADVDPYGEVGLSRSLYGRGERDPYVRRPWVDDALDVALREQDIVLLAGESGAAKWRCAFEAVRRTLPRARLLVPRPGTAALRELIDLDPPLHVGDAPVVVWLEDLERYLGAVDGIDVGVLVRLRALASRVVVVATVSPGIRENLLAADGGLGRAARMVLDRATTIVVPHEASTQDSTDAPPDERPPGGDEPAGAQALERRYQDGRRSDGLGRVGWALTRAAIDWRRAGMFRAISAAELRELGRVYLPAHGPAANPDGEAWAEGLRWAVTTPPDAPAGLLEQRAETTFQAFDHIVSYVDGTGDEIPPAAWEFAMRRSDALELMGVASVAAKRGRTDTAERAWRQLAKSADPIAASFGALMLGQKLTDQGDVKGAIAEYERAMSLAPGNLAVAGVNLGQLLEKQGDPAGAVAVYRKVIALDDPAGAPLAALNLAGLLRRQGDLAAARSAYEQALAAYTAHGDQDGMHGMAAWELGTLLADQGQIPSALTALKVAVASKHRIAKPRAAVRMGLELVHQGDRIGATEAFHIALTAEDDPEVVAVARYQLAGLQEDSDPAMAEAMYCELADAGVRTVSPLAMLRLGELLEARGDVPGARQAYQRAMDSDHSVYAGMSAFSLGKLLAGKGDLAGARIAYQRAIDGGHPDSGALAAVELSQLLTSAGDLAGALSACRRAVRSGHPDAMPRAEVVLGIVLGREGDLAGARAAYQRAIDSGHANAAAMALFNLGKLLGDHRDHAGAVAAYRQAIDSGDPDMAPRAAYNLAANLQRQGDHAGARAAFEFAADSGHPEVAPRAMVFLGEVLLRLRDVDGARAAFQRAARSGDPDAVERARERLAWLSQQHRERPNR